MQLAKPRGYRSVGASCLIRTSACAAIAALLPAAASGQSVPASTPAKADSSATAGPAGEIYQLSVGRDLYPDSSIATDQPRFDPSSQLLVNTVGARTGLFGAASREGLTWANRYVPGTDQSGFVQLYSLSTSGNYAAFFGARSSDNRSKDPQNVIGSISLVVADGDAAHRHWASYQEGYIPRGETAFRLLINDENSIQNSAGDGPIADPYQVNPDHLSNNLRLDCGIGDKGAHLCSTPLSILNNGASYRDGIIFGNDAIEKRDGIADAIAMPGGYALGWYAPSGGAAWQMFSTASGPGAGKLILGDERLLVSVGSGPLPALQVAADAIMTPAEIATGAVPVISGSCPADDQRGGNSAGAFTLTRDCSRGTLTLKFAVAAPTGWSCSASDMTRDEATLRESSYGETSATFAVSAARAGDAMVFRCTGF